MMLGPLPEASAGDSSIGAKHALAMRVGAAGIATGGCVDVCSMLRPSMASMRAPSRSDSAGRGPDDVEAVRELIGAQW